MIAPRVAAASAALCILLGGAAQAQQSVDLALVLAVDSSGSVDANEFRLQMDGLAGAFRHPVVVQAIERGEHGAIAVTLFEWSSQGQQHVGLPWTVVSDAESADVVAAIIDNSPRSIIGGSTSISDALRFAAALFPQCGCIAERMVVDVSGDGSNNNGPPPDMIRDQLVERGIVINGLTILTEEPRLREYFEASVIGGTGAFVMVAEDYRSFGNAVLAKLLTEIASIPAPQLAEVR